MATCSEYGSGGRIRTRDLWVMSPTSYQTAPPRNTIDNIVWVLGLRKPKPWGLNDQIGWNREAPSGWFSGPQDWRSPSQDPFEPVPS